MAISETAQCKNNLAITNFDFMKVIIVGFLLNLMLLFTICVSGQTNSFPNELKEFEFYQKGKLQKILLLISNEKDVRKVFGKSCDSGCDYDENWTVSFFFVKKSAYISETSKDGKEQKFYAPAKYIGTIISIRFSPKTLISIDERLFLTSFTKVNGYGSGVPTDPYAILSSKFSDRNGLEYTISEKNNLKDKDRKSNVTSIEYGITENRKEEIWGLTKYYEKSNKRLK